VPTLRRHWRESNRRNTCADMPLVCTVSDPQTSQLECTLWDDSDADAKNHANFLGEVRRPNIDG